jgi:hypothetical protein
MHLLGTGMATWTTALEERRNYRVPVQMYVLSWKSALSYTVLLKNLESSFISGELKVGGGGGGGV